jgi:hypothetical protein
VFRITRTSPSSKQATRHNARVKKPIVNRAAAVTGRNRVHGSKRQPEPTPRMTIRATDQTGAKTSE